MAKKRKPKGNDQITEILKQYGSQLMGNKTIQIGLFYILVSTIREKTAKKFEDMTEEEKSQLEWINYWIDHFWRSIWGILPAPPAPPAEAFMGSKWGLLETALLAAIPLSALSEAGFLGTAVKGIASAVA